MLECSVMVGFAVLSGVAMIIALYPFRRHKKGWLVLFPVLLCFVALGYGLWGAWPEWQASIQKQKQQQRVQALLQSVNGLQSLINTLQAHLKTHPNSARGWYLLGRLYASQSQWDLAYDAFQVAHRLKPNDEQITANYEHSLLLTRH